MPNLPDWLIAVIAGVVEGITEFLPISSTGHLIVTSEFLQFDSVEGTFEIFIQIGAVIAVLFFYQADLRQQAQNFFASDVAKNRNARQLWFGVLLAFIPAAVIGLLFDDLISSILFDPNVVAVALIVGGIMFIGIEQYLKTDDDKVKAHDIADEPLTYKQAFIVGC
ncbi:MAG: undecaprenyl-diphosphate phosphatase, partial [Chloroflexota bacterium]